MPFARPREHAAEVTPAQRHRLWRDTGAFFKNLRPWQWFTTLTFDRPVGRAHALAAFRDWLRLLAREVVHAHVTALWVLERGASRLFHVHALLHVDGRAHVTPADRIRSAWSGDNLAIARRLDRGWGDRARVQIDDGPARASTSGQG